jgi:hypothetical protein
MTGLIRGIWYGILFEVAVLGSMAALIIINR